MKQIKKCKVIGYTGNSAIIEIEGGMRTYLPGYEISDINIPVNQKVFVGQTLIVCVEESLTGTMIRHKSLMVNKEMFLENHLGESMKGRIVLITQKGCMVELAGNVYCYTEGICNVKPGTMVWVSISMSGWTSIDSILYDEDAVNYPTYQYEIGQAWDTEYKIAA